MLNKENQSWQDITDLINKVLLVEGKEISQIKYIMEKTQYFYNLLMGDFKKKRKVDEQTILLEDTITNEEYLAYYNILTKAIYILKNRPLNAKDYYDENSIVRELVWEENKQYFITLEKGMLRVDVLNSYTDTDMITSYYSIKNIAYIIMSRQYNSLWELINSYEFQTRAIPLNTICSEIRANIDGEPKCQTIYAIKEGEKQFILQTSIDKQKNIKLNPFVNHENVVETAIEYQNDLKRDLRV